MKEPERAFLTLKRKTSANCMIYALLKKDQELLLHLAPGVTPPEPELYDPTVHRKHRMGQYQSSRSGERLRNELQLPAN
jgi:hypothetical protein